MPLTPKSTFCKNINELQEQDYEVNEKNDHVPDNIPNPTTKQYTPTYKPLYWDGIYQGWAA